MDEYYPPTMTISEMIERLRLLRMTHGDLPVHAEYACGCAGSENLSFKVVNGALRIVLDDHEQPSIQPDA